MADVPVFALLIAGVCAGLTLAVLSNRVSAPLRVPAPAFFLLGAALLSDLVPSLDVLSLTAVQRIVTVALAVILFDGGMSIGWRRFRTSAGAIAWIGVTGTVVTAAALAAVARWLFGFDWSLALLLATALAPTDPAVVFSVFGRREVAGRSGVLLAGESGANDPVGIALMAALLTAGTATGWSAVGSGAAVFFLEMAVGSAVGILGGIGLLWFSRRVALPAEGLYPIRVLAGVGVIFGVATIAHGSGFLAVFIAGIVMGDARAPYKREVERFHSALASLGEIVAFTLLGLTVQLRTLLDGNAWVIGLVLAVALAFVIRPVLVGLLMVPLRLQTNERIFVLWSGLKGAVPILLGTYVLTSGRPGSLRVYDVIFVVVAFSVVVQAGLVPVVAKRVRLPMRTVNPEPWALGMRFRDEPDGLRRYEVAAGSRADGGVLADLPFGEDAWVSFVSRDGQLLQLRGQTVLRAGDQVLVLANPGDLDAIDALFTPR